MYKVLLIEDDNSIAELERDYLEINGFACDIADRGRKGLELLEKGNYSLVVVDIMLPDIDGFEVCTRIREKYQLPIIFLSARNDDIDKIRGLGLGADDYMTKPFSPNELVARVKAHIARYNTLLGNRRADDDILEIHGLSINKSSRKIEISGREIPMPTKEFDLLLYLAENPGRVFSKDSLFDTVWGFDSLGDASTVTVHIQRIRDKIEKDGIKYIETVWGVGYRFRS